MHNGLYTQWPFNYSDTFVFKVHNHIHVEARFHGEVVVYIIDIKILQCQISY